MLIRYLSKTLVPITNGLTRGNVPVSLCCHNFCSIVSDTLFDRNENGQVKKKKTVIIPKISLIQDGQLSITTLENAQKISKRRDLKLVKIIDVDTKTQRPVYKLMTGSEYHAEDLKQRAQKKADKQNSIKGEKVLIINQNIHENDLQTYIKKINKWLNKLYEVRIVINGDISNMEKAEAVYGSMEKTVGPGVKIVQKRQKGSDIRFQLLPPKKNEDGNL